MFINKSITYSMFNAEFECEVIFKINSVIIL